MPAATIRRFVQILGGPVAVSVTAGSTTHVTATATAASRIVASPGSTATVTAALTAPTRITASAGATAAATSLGTYAPVGVLGAPVQSASGGAISGLAYGQTPTAGNLLVALWCGEGAATTPATPAGWTAQTGHGGISMQSKTFSKIAAGGDAVPTFGAITSQVQTVMLGEFSGNPASAVPDQQAGNNVPLTGSITTNMLGGADAYPGELVVYACGVFHSAAVTDTENATLNGAAANNTNNNAASTANHYTLGWGITTSNASPDQVIFTYSATSVTGAATAITGFKAALVPVQVTAASQIAPVVQATTTVTATLTAPQLIVAPVSSTATMTSVFTTSVPAPFAASIMATSVMTTDLTAPFLPPIPERRQYVHAVYVRI